VHLSPLLLWYSPILSQEIQMEANSVTQSTPEPPKQSPLHFRGEDQKFHGSYSSSETLHAWATEIVSMTIPRGRLEIPWKLLQRVCVPRPLKWLPQQCWGRIRNPMEATSVTLHTWGTEIASLTTLRGGGVNNPIETSSETLCAWATEIASRSILRQT